MPKASKKTAKKSTVKKKVAAKKKVTKKAVSKKTTARKKVAATKKKVTKKAAAKKKTVAKKATAKKKTIKKAPAKKATAKKATAKKAPAKKTRKRASAKPTELFEGFEPYEAANFPDPNDRATQESEFSLELRARDRERKLIKKIDESLIDLENGEYGYCESCGVEIGIRRLEARPTATLCIDCKTLDEIREKQRS